MAQDVKSKPAAGGPINQHKRLAMGEAVDVGAGKGASKTPA